MLHFKSHLSLQNKSKVLQSQNGQINDKVIEPVLFKSSGLLHLQKFSSIKQTVQENKIAKAQFVEFQSEDAQQEDCKKEDAAASEERKSISNSSESDSADGEDQKRPDEYHPSVFDYQNKFHSNSEQQPCLAAAQEPIRAIEERPDINDLPDIINYAEELKEAENGNEYQHVAEMPPYPQIVGIQGVQVAREPPQQMQQAQQLLEGEARSPRNGEDIIDEFDEAYIEELMRDA